MGDVNTGAEFEINMRPGRARKEIKMAVQQRADNTLNELAKAMGLTPDELLTQAWGGSRLKFATAMSDEQKGHVTTDDGRQALEDEIATQLGPDAVAALATYRREAR